MLIGRLWCAFMDAVGHSDRFDAAMDVHGTACSVWVSLTTATCVADTTVVRYRLVMFEKKKLTHLTPVGTKNIMKQKLPTYQHYSIHEGKNLKTLTLSGGVHR